MVKQTTNHMTLLNNLSDTELHELAEQFATFTDDVDCELYPDLMGDDYADAILADLWLWCWCLSTSPRYDTLTNYYSSLTMSTETEIIITTTNHSRFIVTTFDNVNDVYEEVASFPQFQQCVNYRAECGDDSMVIFDSDEFDAD